MKCWPYALTRTRTLKGGGLGLTRGLINFMVYGLEKGW